jgi:hypothetical protein
MDVPIENTQTRAYEHRQRKHELGRSSYAHIKINMSEELVNLYLHLPKYSYWQHVRMDGLTLLQRWRGHIWLSMVPLF